jgi:hypothetical protein
MGFVGWMASLVLPPTFLCRALQFFSLWLRRYRSSICTLFTRKFRDVRPHFLLSLSICSLPPPFRVLSLSQRARTRRSSLHFALSEFCVSVSLYVCTTGKKMSGYMSESTSSSSSSQTGVHLHAAGITSKHFSFLFNILLTTTQQSTTHTNTPHTQLTRSMCIANMHFMHSHSFLYTNTRQRFLIVCPKATHVPSYRAEFVLILCFIFVLIDSMHTCKALLRHFWGSTKALAYDTMPYTHVSIKALLRFY